MSETNSYPPSFPPNAYQQPPKKKRKWPWILGGILIIFIAIVGGCTALVSKGVDSVNKESKREVAVTYRVTGNPGGTATVTWTDQNGNIAQDTNAKVPWEKNVTVSGLSKYASVSVSNSAEGTDARTTCEILVNNKVVYTQTANGPGANAQCSGSVDGK